MPELVGTYDSVDDLQSALYSDSLYTNPVVYDFLCSGIESGNFKNTKPRSQVTISEMITPAHEAHFRAELWYALPHVAFRHSISNTHAKERQKKWAEFLPLVFQDRLQHEEEAHATRSLNIAQRNGHLDDGGDNATADELMDVADDRYWA